MEDIKGMYKKIVKDKFPDTIKIDMGGHCLLYTSDAADDLLCVDLGGRRIIKKKKASLINKQQMKIYTTSTRTCKTL